MRRTCLPRHFQVKLLPSAKDYSLEEGVDLSHEHPIPAAVDRDLGGTPTGCFLRVKEGF